MHSIDLLCLLCALTINVMIFFIMSCLWNSLRRQNHFIMMERGRGRWFASERTMNHMLHKNWNKRKNTLLFYQTTEFPSEIVRIISEFSKPITHERWRCGSHTANALYDSALWKDYIYDYEGELDQMPLSDNWTFYRWLKNWNHFNFHKHLL